MVFSSDHVLAATPPSWRSPLLPLPRPQTSPMLARSATSKAIISSLFAPITPLLLARATTTACSSLPLRTLSTRTPYPLYYDLITHSPPRRPRSRHHRRDPQAAAAVPGEPGSSAHDDGHELDHTEGEEEDAGGPEGPRGGSMDRSKRKYYRKMAKRMYGGLDDDVRAAPGEETVELKPEVVEFPTLHRREEELYFYDTFAMPWEKDKHYRMVYQLEKKYFPDQCLDKAFADPDPEPVVQQEKKLKGRRHGGGEKMNAEERDERGLVFFEDEGERKGGNDASPIGGDVTEKKVEEFFKCLNKVPSGSGSGGSQSGSVPAEPFLASRRTGLPPRWDGPSGTVVLVDKPKGWTSFTVCGKLRRLVKVQKVGHAGTLDPMATGLLIVCVGKATKQMERYQGMIKCYSGTCRLGEATSTWDADSPVIQREPWEHIKDEDIRKAAASFCGEIWQVPPMFSAIKVGGERMYEKARRGETVELSPRRISIFQFDIERSLDDRQNLIFRVTCSKGTYIRSLCADLGKALGSCAHMAALRRESIGQYMVHDAWNFQELQEQITKGYL